MLCAYSVGPTYDTRHSLVQTERQVSLQCWLLIPDVICSVPPYHRFDASKLPVRLLASASCALQCMPAELSTVLDVVVHTAVMLLVCCLSHVLSFSSGPCMLQACCSDSTVERLLRN